MITILLYTLMYFIIGLIVVNFDTPRAIRSNTYHPGERRCTSIDRQGYKHYETVRDTFINRSDVKGELSRTLIFWPVLTPFRIMSSVTDKKIDKIDPAVTARKQKEIQDLKESTRKAIAELESMENTNRARQEELLK